MEEEVKLTLEEELQKRKDEITSNEKLAITYQYLKQGRWKTKTEVIESEKLPDYESKFKVLYITTVEVHHKLLAKVKGRR